MMCKRTRKELYDLIAETKEAIERERKAIENANLELVRLKELLFVDFDDIDWNVEDGE